MYYSNFGVIFVMGAVEAFVKELPQRGRAKAGMHTETLKVGY